MSVSCFVVGNFFMWGYGYLYKKLGFLVNI